MRLSLYWCGFVGRESSSRAVESRRHGQSAFLTNDNERSILINGSTLTAIVWRLTFADCFFPSSHNLLFSNWDGSVWLFRTHTHGETPITPVIKKERSRFQTNFCDGKRCCFVCERQAVLWNHIHHSFTLRFSTSLLCLCFTPTDLCTSNFCSHFSPRTHQNDLSLCSENTSTQSHFLFVMLQVMLML